MWHFAHTIETRVVLIVPPLLPGSSGLLLSAPVLQSKIHTDGPRESSRIPAELGGFDDETQTHRAASEAAVTAASSASLWELSQNCIRAHYAPSHHDEQIAQFQCAAKGRGRAMITASAARDGRSKSGGPSP